MQKTNLRGYYMRACTQPHQVILSLVRVTPDIRGCPNFWCTFKVSNQSIFKVNAPTYPLQFVLSCFKRKLSQIFFN